MELECKLGKVWTMSYVAACASIDGSLLFRLGAMGTQVSKLVYRTPAQHYG